VGIKDEWLGLVASLSIMTLVGGCSSRIDDLLREAAKGHHNQGGEHERPPAHPAGGSTGTDASAGAGGARSADAGTAGAGDAAAGGATGSGGASDGGLACATNALTTCAGTMSGPWCVDDHFFADGDPAFPEFNGVWSDGPNDTWAVGGELAADQVTLVGFAFHWDGCAWLRPPLPTIASLNSVWGAADDDVWATSEQGVLHWDGTTWSAVNVGITGNFGPISGTSTTDVWTVGSTGFFHWNGSVWAMAAPGGGQAGGDIWAVAPNDVWATGNGPNVSHWDGSTWTVTEAAEFTNFGLFAIWADADSAWSVGEGQQIAHLAGDTWTHVQPPGGSSRGLWDVMSLGGDVYAVGDAVIHASSGSAFQADTNVPQAADYNSVWLTPSQVWVAGEGGNGPIVAHRAR